MSGEYYHTEECRWCHGSGTEYVERGSSLSYRCPDCRGTGEVTVCDECGNSFDGEFCEDCFEKCPECGLLYPVGEVCPDCAPEHKLADKIAAEN